MPIARYITDIQTHPVHQKSTGKMLGRLDTYIAVRNCFIWNAVLSLGQILGISGINSHISQCVRSRLEGGSVRC